MSIKSISMSCIVFACVGLFASDAFADDKMERLLLEIKKLNTRIVEKVIPQFDRINAEIGQVKRDLGKLKSGSTTLNQQMEILANVIPGIQRSMEQSQMQAIQQVQALGKRMDQLEAKIKAGQQAELDMIKQEIGTNLKSLNDGMAKDMEQIAKLNQNSFQALVQSNEKQINQQNIRMEKTIAVITEMAKGGGKDSETLASLQASLAANSKARSEQNQKIIDILSKSLKEQEASAAKMDSLGGNQTKSDGNVILARDTMVALKEIMDKKLADIEKIQQALQTQVGLSHELTKHTNEKFSMLVDTTKAMLTNSSQMNVKADMSLQRIDDGKAEIRLTSEKISKLIEILKAIAEEQGKLEQLIASKAGKGNNKELMEALADLKRKANVSISRSDSILEKLKSSKK